MMKYNKPSLLAACSIIAALGSLLSASAIEIAEEITSTEIQASASSAYATQPATNLTNSSGMDNGYGHDNQLSAGTMWHTLVDVKHSVPATGLPESPAWVRFDFKQPQTIGSCQIWNHNQLNLTNRGFRHARIYVSADGEAFEKLPVSGQELFEIPQAKGRESEPASFVLPLSGKPVKSIILVATDNWGGNVYGLSEVQFFGPPREVAAESLPIPTTVAATGFPFKFDEGKNRWTRQVNLELDVVLHEAAEVTVTCGDATRITKIEASPRGIRGLLIDLPEGKGNLRRSADPVKVAIKSGRWTKQLETQIEPIKQWPDLEEVVVTWKCHLDIGFTHTAQEVIAKYRGSDIDKLLPVFDATKDETKDDRFLWMLPAWAMELVIDDKQTPERRARLEQAVKDGRLLWHALPYSFEAEACDAEELVRGLGYSSRLAKRFNMPFPTDAKQTDMPEQAWILPTLLKNAGVNFLHIGANDFSKPDSAHAKIPTLSWWEGPDGSRVLLGYSPVYGWNTTSPPVNWPHKTWLAYFVRGDNAGPPAMADIKTFMANARKQLPGVHIHFGRPSEFADAIIKEEEENPTLPVVRGDMPDTWVHGQMSCPEATATHRRASTELGSLGILDTSLRAWGLAPAPVTDSLAQGYDLGGFYGEHTWGMDGWHYRNTYGDAWKKKWEAGHYKGFEASYEFHMDYGRKAKAIADQGLNERMNELAGGINTDGPRVAVFNPLPWVREAQAEIQLPETTKGQSISGLTDAQTGMQVAYLVEGNRLRFMAAQLPAGGYKTYRISTGTQAPAESDAAFSGNTLETARFTAQFDLKRGGIASLKDKTTGKELVDSTRYVLGQFLHERFSLTQVNNYVKTYARGLNTASWVAVVGCFGKVGMPDETISPYLASTPSGWQAKATSTPVGEIVTLTPSDTLGLAKGYTLTFTFPRNQACVDICWSVDGKTPDPIPEGGWLCLPFKVEKPSFRVGRVGGTIDPTKDIIFGANRDLIGVDRGITVRAGESGAGMAAASADLPLWSLGEPGLWKYSTDYVPIRPELFVNLYNNMWTTNYPLWIGGSWKAQLRVWPVAENATEEQAMFTPSWEIRQPVAAGFADGKAGTLPTSQSGVALSRKGVRISAFCPNPDGDGTVFRLWEQAGTEGPITVTLPKGFKATKAHPVNLRGVKAGESVKVKAGQFSADLGEWAPKSWVLE